MECDGRDPPSDVRSRMLAERDILPSGNREIFRLCLRVCCMARTIAFPSTDVNRYGMVRFIILLGARMKKEKGELLYAELRNVDTSCK